MDARILPRLREDAVVRRFDDRGRQPKYVVAIDGHHFVVTRTVAVVLEETRKLRSGECNVTRLAARVAQRLGREIPPAQIQTLLEHHAPRRFFDASAEAVEAETPLKLQRILVSGERLAPLLEALIALFYPRMAVFVLTALVLCDLYVALHFWEHGTSAASALDILLGFVLTLVGIIFHELGHLTGCRLFGGRHGGIGVGLYWGLPAFYAEVDGAWMLPRRARAVVDIGGIYLQACFVGVLGLAYLVVPLPSLLSAIVLSHFLILHTLNPVLKFDGYWLLCDLAGVHNLHKSLRHALRAAFSGQRPSRAEIRLLIAFLIPAAAYVAYTFAMLGTGVGSAAAGLQNAWLAADGSPASIAAILGRALLFAAMLAMSAGIAALLARAARDIARDTDLKSKLQRKEFR